MIKRDLLIIITLLCLAGVFPQVISLSKWFSSSWYDTRIAMLRYGRCIGDLPPLRSSVLSETEYLVNQVNGFLEQGAYDNEQLANVSVLMDNICRDSADSSYAISVNIDVSKYNSSAGKDNRCEAIDEAMDSMFPIFKKASLNKSEPLDFSTIQFYPNASMPEKSYNLTDLINTSWIKSETHLEHVCKITNSIKEFIRNQTSISAPSDRSSSVLGSAHPQSSSSSFFSSIMDLIDRLLDPILGLEKRLYWDSNNRIELIYHSIGNQLSNLRSLIGRAYNGTRNAVFGRAATSSTAVSSGLNSSLPVTSESLKASNLSTV